MRRSLQLRSREAWLKEARVVKVGWLAARCGRRQQLAGLRLGSRVRAHTFAMGFALGGWSSAGRQDGVVPAKVAKAGKSSPARQPKRGGGPPRADVVARTADKDVDDDAMDFVAGTGANDADESDGTPLYGLWQTEPYVARVAVNVRIRENFGVAVVVLVSVLVSVAVDGGGRVSVCVWNECTT